MKKLISIAMAVLMLAAMATTAFATNLTPDTENSATTAIGYTVDPAYTVTIPDTVTLGTTATISASNVVIEKGKVLSVALTATSDAANAFTVTNADDTVSYSIKLHDTTTDVVLNQDVLTVDVDEAQPTYSVQLDFSAPTNEPKYAGSYAGTVTFTIAVEPIS